MRGSGEYCKPAVTLAAGANHLATVGGHNLFDQRVVAGESASHRLAVVLPQARAAFDIRQ
jgi:hypothetical protein